MSSRPTSPSASKRPAEVSDASEAKKRAKTEFDLESKLIVTSQDDLDTGLLRAQNRRLAERLRHRQRVENELRARIDQLEKKQLNEDTKLYAINRYWNQLNEDMRLLLERFEESSGDSEDSPRAGEDGPSNGSDEPNEVGSRKGAHEETTSFVRQLANCDKEELDEALQQRVLLSTRTVSKVLQAFDRIVQRNERVMSALKAGPEPEDPDEPSDQEDNEDGGSRKRAKPNLDTEVRELNEALTRENQRLNCLVTSLHEKHRTVSLKCAQFSDELESRELQVDELKNRIDELEFELNKLKTREQRLEAHLIETREKLRDYQGSGTSDGIGNGKLEVGLSSNKLEDLKRELEEQRELACSRLAELEALNAAHKETLRELEKQKMDMACLPDSVIRESAEYKSLQSRFSVLFNESIQLKNQLEEARQQLTTAKNIHLRQIEQMESDELTFQKKLRTECMQLEDTLAQTRKEYEMLRLEFEQNLAAHEQTGPINKEMRHLISSLQNHIGQVKGENVRVKRKMKEASIELARLRQIIEDAGLRVVGGGILLPSPLHPCVESSEGSQVELPQLTSDSSNDGTGNLVIQSDNPCDDVANRKVEIKQELIASSFQIKRESVDDAAESSFQDCSENSKPDPEMVRDLKVQLKKSHEVERELKLLLDMHKHVDKEKRDKMTLMASEKRLKLELEDLRQQLNKLQEAEKKGNRRRCNDDEYREKVTKYEEAITQLQRNVTSHKLQEEALLNEMEVTGQAFEDMQEQNCRLLQQLREKDDANFKLMSERIKSNQIQKLLKEEKETLTDHVVHLENQMDAQNQVVRKLEDKERILQANLATIEKELSVRQNAMDFHKRKTIEASQAAADLKLHLDKYVAQIKDAQSIVADKTTAWQQETFKTKRLHEEVAHYRRKYERAKKFELATTADEVLQEEIRELREELTCPSCKTKRKDAVLNKCFHVFCYDCLKTRYETRQRKCPKCNQSFSANDFHRLYLA